MKRGLVNPTVEKLSEHYFDLAIQNGIVLMDFWAPWCGPCRMQTVALHGLASRNGARVSIARVNIDDAPELAERFGIQSIPTLILFRDGKLLREFVGVQTKSVLERAIREAAVSR